MCQGVDASGQRRAGVSPPSPVTADVSLAELRAELISITNALAALDVTRLSEGALGETIDDLLRARRQLDGLSAAVAGRFAHSSEWSADGARDAVAWLRGRSSDGFCAARDLFAISSDCAVFPAMGAALRRGDVSARHVRMLGEVSRRFPRLLGHLRDAQQHITALAVAAEPARFRRELIALCHRFDPDAAREDADDRDRECHFRASTVLDGQVRVDGLLPAEVGQLLIAALESARRQIVDDPTPEPTPPVPGVDAFGTPITPDPVDARLTGQRNVEARHRILVMANGPDGQLASVAGQRPQVNVTVSMDALAAETDAAVDCGWLERFGVPTEPVAIDTVRRLACDATVRPLITDSTGNLVAFASATRVIPPAMRALVVRRDRHCRFAGCRARIDEVHHIVFYSRGGPTRSDNLLGLCWHHHHLAHEGDWEVTGNANVEVKGRSPDGRAWTTAPPGG